MKNNIESPDINYASNTKLKYLSDDTFILDLPFILTIGKKLTLGIPYMKSEGRHIDAIKLLDIWVNDGMVYFKIQDLKTKKINTISWNLEYDGGYYLWSLASLDYLTNVNNNFLMVIY